MGLLDKALHGAVAPSAVASGAASPEQREGGFFSKAQAAQMGVKPGAAVGGSDFTLVSLTDLAALRAELLDLPSRNDTVFSIFSRLSEALPLNPLALFFAGDEGLRLAACQGLDSPSDLPLPGFDLPATISSGAMVESASLSSLLPLVGSLPASPLAVSFVRRASDAALQAVCVFGFASPDLLGRQEASILAESIESSFKKIPLPCFTAIPDNPASDLFRSIPPDHCAVAMLFDLEEFAERACQAYPGLLKSAAVSCAVSAAAALLGGRGKVLELGGARMALVLCNSTPLDAELALFQFRKSFARSFDFLAGSGALVGESYSFDPAEGGASEALVRFVSG